MIERMEQLFIVFNRERISRPKQQAKKQKAESLKPHSKFYSEINLQNKKTAPNSKGWSSLVLQKVRRIALLRRRCRNNPRNLFPRIQARGLRCP